MIFLGKVWRNTSENGYITQKQVFVYIFIAIVKGTLRVQVNQTCFIIISTYARTCHALGWGVGFPTYWYAVVPNDGRKKNVNDVQPTWFLVWPNRDKHMTTLRYLYQVTWTPKRVSSCVFCFFCIIC